MTGIIRNGPVRDGRGTYQLHKFEAVCRHARAFRVAIDVGAHVGTWTMQFVRRFASTIAFEPVETHRQCWERNIAIPKRGSSADRKTSATARVGDVFLIPVALGAAAGVAELTWRDGVSGHTYVSDDGIRQAGPNEELRSLKKASFTYMDRQEHVVKGVEVRTLDSFAFDACDVLKIDCEGYEAFVLQGAVDLLKRCHPVVIVEQKEGMGSRYGVDDLAAVRFLEGLGATMRVEIGGDFIMGWGKWA